jgi:hypothetical protein
MRVPRFRQGEQQIRVGNTVSGSPSFIYGAYRDGLFVSVGHYRLPNGGWSGGGPFLCQKVNADHGTGYGVRWTNFGSRWFGNAQGVSTGTQYRVSTLPASESYPAVYERLLVPYATARARTRPGRPMAGLGQFLIELRDLPTVPGKARYRTGQWRKMSLPSLGWYLRDTVAKFRALGPEYLNIVFGWEPFVRDLREVYNLWKRVDREMASLIRNNRKGVRRKVTLEDSTSTSQTETHYAYPFANVWGGPPFWTAGHTHHKVTTVTRKRVWYAAQYMHWIPNPTSSQWTIRARLALFGALPTPELLWEVMPWSWLIDWFSNAGDVISNVSPTAVDYVTMYSFLMEHTLVTKEHTSECQWDPKIFPAQNINIPGGSHTFSTTNRVESKARVGSVNPFGLGVQLPSLTGRQLGILAALGLSRSSVR